MNPLRISKKKWRDTFILLENKFILQHIPLGVFFFYSHVINKRGMKMSKMEPTLEAGTYFAVMLIPQIIVLTTPI